MLQKMLRRVFPSCFFKIVKLSNGDAYKCCLNCMRVQVHHSSLKIQNNLAFFLVLLLMRRRLTITVNQLIEQKKMTLARVKLNPITSVLLSLQWKNQ